MLAVMTMHGLLLVVALAAGGLALWLDVRFASKGPRTPAGTFGHLAGALLALKLSTSGIVLIVAGSDSPGRKMLALFVALLPPLIYGWLSSIWLLKLLQRSAHLR
jgi:hypothetical protein